MSSSGLSWVKTFLLLLTGRHQQHLLPQLLPPVDIALSYSILFLASTNDIFLASLEKQLEGNRYTALFVARGKAEGEIPQPTAASSASSLCVNCTIQKQIPSVTCKNLALALLVKYVYALKHEFQVYTVCGA